MKQRRERRKFSPDNIKNAEFMFVFALVLFAVTFGAVSFYAGMEEVISRFSALNWYVFVGVFLLSIVNFFTRGVKWTLFADRLGLKVPARRMYQYYFAGQSMVITPGKIGTGLRIWLLRRCHNVSYSKSLPLMIMDPVIDLASLFLLSVLGAFSFSGHNVALALFGTILGVTLILLSRPKLFIRCIKLTYWLFGKRKTRFFALLQKFVRYITHLVSPKLFSLAVGLSLVGWGGSCFAFWWVLTEMGADITYYQAVFVFAFSTILGGASMMPGGLGGTEASMVLLLLAIGVPKDIAIAGTALIRLAILWFGVGFGFLFLPNALKLAKS